MSGASHIVDCGNSEFSQCERGDLASDSQASAENGPSRPYFPVWSGTAGERKEGGCTFFQNSFGTEFPEASQFIEAVFQGYFAFSGGGCFTFIAGNYQFIEKENLKS